MFLSALGPFTASFLLLGTDQSDGFAKIRPGYILVCFVSFGSLGNADPLKTELSLEMIDVVT